MSSATRIEFPGLPEPRKPVEKPDAGAEKPVVEKKRVGFGGWMRRLTGGAALLVALLILPLVVLLRFSVYLYRTEGLGTWPSLLGGAGATTLLAAVLIWALTWRLTGRLRPSLKVLKGTTVLVATYSVYALLFLASQNAKSPEIQEVYTSLHPLIRVAVSTMVLVDREAVVTDTQRTAEDYISWGLPVNESSLHFRQDGGFVHAVDLRTVGRPELANRIVEIYFQAIGFRTLRHVGTADHLHVSLPPGP